MMQINQVCFRNLANDLASYKKIGGYSVWRDLVSHPEKLDNALEEIKISKLRGRGGAGFLSGLKLSFVKRNSPGQKYILCNADEGEPGTFKDRDIMKFNPHQLLEGMAIAGLITGATVGYIYVRGEFRDAIASLENAINVANKANILGEKVFATKNSFVVHTFYGAGSYICGEETAMIESLEGKKGFPRFKPPFPASNGLYGCPSTINNVETLASIPVILAKGGKWHADLGTESGGGCKIFCVSGHVNKPGNYELPLGTPFRELLKLAGGVKGERPLKAVIPGGLSAPVLPAAIINQLKLDYKELADAGSMLGSGGVIVMNDTTCMVQVLARITKFYMEESCGQCSPCREGTGWMHKLVQKINSGEGALADINTLDNIASNIGGSTVCALGDAAMMPVRSFIKHFRNEFVAKIIRN